MNKTCSTCHEAKPLSEFHRRNKNPDGYQHQCRACRRNQERLWRERNPEKYQEYRQREGERRRAQREVSDRFYDKQPYAKQAYYYIRIALRIGDLTRPSCCEDCGEEGRVHAHHHDYTLPLDVRWLCESCHRLLHNREARVPV